MHAFLNATAAPVTSDSDGPSLRLCIVKKWTTFQGYGFNLNAEKGRVGNFIGGIDSGSPAEAAGVKKNDLIIEVNGCDVAESDHKMVVSQILKNPSEVRLLLIDPDSAKYYKNKGTKISGSLPNIVTITCPDKAPDNGKCGRGKLGETPGLGLGSAHLLFQVHIVDRLSVRCKISFHLFLILVLDLGCIYISSSKWTNG